MPVRVLITGASGYLGGWLSDSLTKRTSVEVIHGVRHHLPPDSTAQYVPFDLGDTSTYDRALDGIDVLVNLAGMSQDECTRSPSECMRLNAVNPSILLRYAKNHKVKRVLHVSTIQVLGQPLPRDIRGPMPVSPANVYAQAHAEAEVRLGEPADLRVDIVRLANGFGFPRNAARCWHLAINDFCRQAVITGEIRLTSSGRQQRNFVSTRAIAGFLAHLVDSPTTSGCRQQIWTFGSPRSQTVLSAAHQVAKRWTHQSGRKTTVLPLDQVEPEQAESCLDLSPIEMLGFNLDCLTPDAHLLMIDDTLQHCRNSFLS